MNIIYNVCRRTILNDAPADMADRLELFYKKGKLTTAQYNELLEML